MLRATAPALSGLVEMHEWHLREPLLQNYDGWRILDNPKYENKLDAYTWDIVGSVRHLDPIIDDPRLTHKQRVCRLYRWALKELIMNLTKFNSWKFNLGYKVVRGRFEKYRYVTDPAMCDLMVRESQKYLREVANYHFLKRNAGSSNMNLSNANPMWHPDHNQVYDHWTQPEVFWYDDAKTHRWNYHDPMFSAAPAQSRYGVRRFSPALDTLAVWLWIAVHASFFYIAYFGFTWSEDAYDVKAAHVDPDLRGAMFHEERLQRERGTVAWNNDWNLVLGKSVNTPQYNANFLNPQTYLQSA